MVRPGSLAAIAAFVSLRLPGVGLVPELVISVGVYPGVTLLAEQAMKVYGRRG